MRFKRFKLCSVEIIISMEDRLAERLRAGVLHRYVVRPILNFLSRLFATERGAAVSFASKETFDESLQEKMKSVYAEQPELLIPNKLLNAHKTADRFKASPEQQEIYRKIGGFDWYHSIDLGHGVVTPGAFEHQPYLSNYHLPDRLDGMRILDVATFDGFWSFEFEKRGASEVVAMDIETFNEIELPMRVKKKIPAAELNTKTGQGFHIAREILGSNVRREILNIYDLSPEKLGKFDMVFCGDLLLHLMNPMQALQNIRSVVSGYAHIVETCYLELDRHGNGMSYYASAYNNCIWWIFSRNCLEQMIKDAGFGKVELLGTFKLGLGQRKKSDISADHAVFKAYP